MADCTPESLAESAKSFQGLSSKSELAIQAFLLAQIAGVSTDPNTLLANSAQFQSLSDKQLAQVHAYLLCQIAGGV